MCSIVWYSTGPNPSTRQQANTDVQLTFALKADTNTVLITVNYLVPTVGQTATALATRL
jgi:hypothetical protein